MNDTKWNNCTNEELVEALRDTPEIIEELKKIGYNDLVNAYDALLPKYNMDRMTVPMTKEDSEEIECFGYWYSIDGTMHDMDKAEGYMTKAEAQIASINDTKRELESRIKAKRNPYYN